MAHIPLVSIIIVTWNRREDAAKAIHSATKQDYPNIETIVVDNASTDGTSEMVRADFPAVRLIRSDINLGCPSGRNLGIKSGKGEYFYLLDDDGILEKSAVTLAVDRAEANPSLGVVLSARQERDQYGVHFLPARNPRYQASFIGCCALIRAMAINQVGLFPDDFFRQAEEEDLAIRLLDAGWFCFLEPRSIMHHARNQVGRDQRALNYYSLRNSTKTGLRLWPFPYNIGRLLVNGFHGFRIFCMRGDLRTFGSLTIDLFRDLACLKRQRRPVRFSTMRLYRRLQLRPTERLPFRRIAAR